MRKNWKMFAAVTVARLPHRFDFLFRLQINIATFTVFGYFQLLETNLFLAYVPSSSLTHNNVSDTKNMVPVKYCKHLSRGCQKWTVKLANWKRPEVTMSKIVRHGWKIWKVQHLYGTLVYILLMLEQLKVSKLEWLVL